MMIEIARKDFLLPLKEKIDIMGLRIETGQNPKPALKADKIRLTDRWIIQLAYAPFNDRKQYLEKTAPQYAEFPLNWEAELDWGKKGPADFSAVYKKKPRCLEMHVQEHGRYQFFLHLNTEAMLEIIPKELPAAKTIAPTGSISGSVLESYRLLPLPKATIEFYRDAKDEPAMKLEADGQGKYCCTNLVPGTYDVKIKHPRYATLVIKDYTVLPAENKYQDFLLRK